MLLQNINVKVFFKATFYIFYTKKVFERSPGSLHLMSVPVDKLVNQQRDPLNGLVAANLSVVCLKRGLSILVSKCQSHYVYDNSPPLQYPGPQQRQNRK